MNYQSFYMNMALRLAAKGKNRVFPNPMVGCVIVKNGRVVGKGYHSYFGAAHAEIVALKDAGAKSKDADMYVTLEPCSHWGKTPPCVRAIVKGKIKRIYIAMIDPNPKVSGNGVNYLKKHGISVFKGILNEKARKLNNLYINTIKNRTPRITVKTAMTLDGKIATRMGDSKWISSEKSRHFVHKLRSCYDAVLVGANTVIKDNPKLDSHGKGRDPIRVVLDPNMKVPVSRHVFDGKTPTVLIINKIVKGKLEVFRHKRVLILKIPARKSKFNFKTIINELSKIAINKVLVEGGGEAIASAFKAGVVNEYITFINPHLLIGGDRAVSPIGGGGVSHIRKGYKLINPAISKSGTDIMVRGKVKYLKGR